MNDEIMTLTAKCERLEQENFRLQADIKMLMAVIEEAAKANLRLAGYRQWLTLVSET